MATLPRGSLVEVGEHRVNYEDVVLAGIADGSWPALVAWCAEGTQRQRERGISRADVRRAAESFRRQRKLEAGEDLRAWLAARAITMSDWETHLRRAVALADVTLSPSRPAPLSATLGNSLRVDSFCRGFWESEARRLLSWLAAAELVGPVAPSPAEIDPLVTLAVNDDTAELGATGEAWCRQRLTTLMAWRGAHDRLGENVADEPTIARFVAERSLDWTVVTLEACVVATESAAREALLCATEDGLPPGQIADRARGEVEYRTVRAEELGDGLATRLLSAELDTPVGPIGGDCHWSIVWVRHREPPGPADPVIRADVRAALVVEAVKRQLTGRDIWRGPV